MEEVVLLKLPLLKLMVMFVATLWKRLVKAAKPFVARAVRVPCKVPLPALREAVTTVLLSALPLAALRRLPNLSWTPMPGCWANTTPAVAVGEG